MDPFALRSIPWPCALRGSAACSGCGRHPGYVGHRGHGVAAGDEERPSARGAPVELEEFVAARGHHVSSGVHGKFQAAKDIFGIYIIFIIEDRTRL